MNYTDRDVNQLKKLVLRAKEVYYEKGRFLRVDSQKLTPFVATAIKYSVVSRGKAVLPERTRKVSGIIEIDDKTYDLIEDIIKKLDPSWKPVVGTTVKNKKFKTELPFAMGSLDKCRAGEGSVSKFSSKYKGPYVLSDKLDGNALEIVYSKTGIKAYTRTSDTIGQDVSFLVPHMNIPKLNIELAIRAETILPIEKFENKYKDEYKNARNMTAGIFNTQGVHKALKDIDVVVHQVLSPSIQPSKGLEKLKKLGFTVVPYQVVSRISDDVLSTFLKKRKKLSHYNIDGIVVTEDKVHRLPSSGNPDYAFAFKEEGEDNLAETKVLEIQWNPSKHGLLKPRVRVEPVELAGATVKWVTAYNAKYVVDNKIGPGAIVKLTRSGEVIPKVIEVVKPAKKPQMPDVPYVWNKTNVDIILDEDSDEIEVKKISAFLVSGLGVEALAQGYIQRCYENGIDTVGKFLKASPTTFLRVPGIKETLANKFYQQIQKGSTNADLASVAANSGFFGSLFGTKRIQAIIDKYDIFKLATMQTSSIIERVSSLPGFKDTTAIAFAEGLPKFVKWISHLPITFKSKERVKVSGSALKGQAVCFTGFRNKELEQKIISEGGTIASGVNKNTTILLVSDLSSSSSKVVKAKQLGILVMTEQQFKAKYKV